MTDLADLSLTEVAHAIRSGELSSEHYTRRLLERIEEHTDLNAFITVYPEAVLAAARIADRELAHGGSTGPLHGVPLAIKDNIDTAELPTTGGTPALRTHRPVDDAAAVAALRAAGAIVLGKTNLHELAYGVTSDNTAFGAVRNPYRSDRIAGGSSGGTAAAVAARLVPAGLGTDTGGSIRIPASLCGITGLRPTIERYAQRGIVLLSRTKDTIGTMARSVADLELLDSVLCGEHCAAVESDIELAGIRLGVLTEFTAGISPGISRVLEQRLAELRACGIELIDVKLPAGTAELIAKAGFPIAFHETTVELPRYLAATPSAPTPAEVIDQCASADVRQLLVGLFGSDIVSLADYRDALSIHRPALGETLRTIIDRHQLSALVAPTTPLTAMPIGAQTVTLGSETLSAFLAYTRTTNPGSIIGWPGVTLPAGLDDDGLPIGLSVDGLPGTDRALLRLARSLESRFGPLPPPRS